MAKFFTNPLIEGISGLIGKFLVLQLRWDCTPIRGIQTAGIMRRLGQHASYGQILTNIRKSFSLIAAAWMNQSTAVQQTWVVEAKLLSQANSVFYSGYDYFMAYCMVLYAAQFSSSVNMTSLTSSSTFNYVDRADFVWTP